MVTILTGPVGSGKSTRLKELYKKNKTGDGFYNVRRVADGTCIGQDIVQLSSGLYIPFSRIEGCLPQHWDGQYRYHSFSFSREGIRFAESILDQVEEGGTAYIDEYGPLEMKRQGLFDSIVKCNNRKVSLYIVVRSACTESFVALIKEWGQTFIIDPDTVGSSD